MSKLRSRLSTTSINSYVSNMFAEGARFSKPIQEIQSGSIDVNPIIEEVKELELVIEEVKEIQDEPKNETLGEVIGLSSGEEGQVSEVEGLRKQEISIVPDKKMSRSSIKGPEILGSEAAEQPEGEQTLSDQEGFGLRK